ncbi:MAG TPA: hypothetical protein PJ988_18200 [Anaerolinea sp.]|nr:hypothetical protein [Anaerolinea sp.]
MDAIIKEKIDHLLPLVRGLDKDRAAQIFPGGLEPLIEAIQNLSPHALISLLETSNPLELRRASAQLLLAMLLDTDRIQRYGLILALSHTPIRDYIQPLLEAVDDESLPDEIRRLGQITARQVYFTGCNTYACACHRFLSTRSLLRSLAGYAH